jgi:hypothetical protein
MLVSYMWKVNVMNITVINDKIMNYSIPQDVNEILNISVYIEYFVITVDCNLAKYHILTTHV